MTSGNRPFGHQIMTLDVALEINAVVPGDVLARVTEHGAADAIASKWADTAAIAVQKFIETYRDCKYLRYRGNDRWSDNQTLVPRITDREFNTFLFYVLRGGCRAHVCGCRSVKARMMISEPTGGDFRRNVVSARLQESVPPHRQLIQMSSSGTLL